MKKNYNKIITKIALARKKNNINWMNLLKISIKYAPNQSKKILRDINSQDKKISQLLEKITKK
tara:strand:+ start:1024 stop:1212 length:189 start_codon:yes stop_codon:yes gene_type:complete